MKNTTTVPHQRSFSLLRSYRKTTTTLMMGIMFMFTLQMQSQLIGWDAATSVGFGASPWATSTLNSNLVMSSSGLIRGSAIATGGTPGSFCWGGSGGWGTTDAGSVYFSFTAAAGYKVSLSSISSALRRSSTGPTNCNIEFSINGGAYTTVDNWAVNSTSGTTGTANSSVLSGYTTLQNVAAGTTIKFRISFPGSPSGNWYLTGGANSLKLNGTVTAVPTCTSPTAILASNIGTNAADLSWNALTGISGYEYTLDQVSAAPTNSGTAISTNSYSASSLNPGTVYYMHVRTNCGSSVFSSWATSSFTTAAACATPTITSLSSNGPVCSNKNLNLLLNVSGTAPLTYTWTGAGNFNSVSVKSPTVTNAATGNYSVAVSNACGVTTSVISVTVNPLPLISITNATVCAGSTAILNAGGAATYTWSTSQTTQSISVSPLVTTSYTAIGKDANGCVNTQTTSVTVNALPVITVNTPSICAGSTVILNAAGATTYIWSTSETTQSISVTPLATTVYTAIGTDANGCVNTQTTSVMVNALPVITVNTPSICAGSTTTLTAAGATTYTWSTSETTQNISVTPLATTVYTAIGTDANGCVNTQTTSVMVNALPVITVNTPSICIGSTATLTATGATTYTWSTSETTQNISVTPLTTTVYSVSGTDVNACVNTQTASVVVNNMPVLSVNTPTICAGTSATLVAGGANTYTWSTMETTQTILVNPLVTTAYTLTGTGPGGCGAILTTSVIVNAKPVITVNSATICAGSTATLTALGVNSYTWSNGSTTSGIQVSPLSTTGYTVSGKDANACVNTQTTTVVVHVLPALSFSTIAGPLCINHPSVTLVALPAGGTFSGAGVTGTTFNPALAGAGTFTLSYHFINGNSCSGTVHSTVVVDACTGIHETVKNIATRIYPNPVQDALHVSFESADLRRIEIYNNLGALVYTEAVSENEFSVSTAGFSQGLYILKVSSAGAQSVVRFVKQ